MFGQSFRLFTIFGFTVKIDPSWFLLALLLTWSLAEGLYHDPALFPQLQDAPAARWIMGAAASLGLFLSIVLHELGHSLVARRYGLPIRGITLFIFGGVAEMADEPPTPRSELVMAIAGPSVSVLLAGLFYAANLALLPITIKGVLGWLAFINLALAIFNLIPAFPLDGGRVLRSILWSWKGQLRWATRITAQIGAGFGIALIVLGVLVFIRGNFIGGVWWFLIGMFLRNAARMSYQQLLVRGALEGEPVRRFMKPDPMVAPPEISLSRFVEDYVYRYHYKFFPVMRDGHVVGCISTRQLSHVPREEWPERTVAEVAAPCSASNSISPDADAIEAFRKMNRTHRSRLMVVDHDGRLLGIVALKDLMEFLSLKLELEPDAVAQRKAA